MACRLRRNRQEIFQEGKVMRFKLMLPMAAILIGFYGGQAWAAPVVVSCGAGQHTVVRDAWVRGEPVTRVVCAGGPAYGSTAYDGARYYRTQEVVVHHPVRRHRSWGKTALVVGGSAATGAGIGGAVHGKKGALVGAALGGGVASLYEAAHRR
jgi:hypothetical protein